MGTWMQQRERRCSIVVTSLIATHMYSHCHNSDIARVLIPSRQRHGDMIRSRQFYHLASQGHWNLVIVATRTKIYVDKQRCGCVIKIP
jgi:hypothetical protein